ncbi:hypothetical protein LBMAG15_15620 [Actinomycetes bacterium]|nr:hypothetical protein LBMAG15_15620 [Actinomycetes bacterium]
MPLTGELPGVGAISLCPIDDGYPRQTIESPYENWGEMAAAATSFSIDRWCIRLLAGGAGAIDVGYLSAHVVWYGPTFGSRAMNIGISIMAGFRGQGIGALCQQLLAEHLHEQGFVRVEASTDIENLAEQRALAAAGFHLEGTARQAQSRADGVHDLQVWSHIADC